MSLLADELRHRAEASVLPSRKAHRRVRVLSRPSASAPRWRVGPSVAKSTPSCLGFVPLISFVTAPERRSFRREKHTACSGFVPPISFVSALARRSSYGTRFADCSTIESTPPWFGPLSRSSLRHRAGASVLLHSICGIATQSQASFSIRRF
jgi:hypothetical protein